MQQLPEQPGRLIITADDWGYSARYNAGIEEAVRAGAVDAVSVMVLRPACDSAPLLEAGVEVGLHLEVPRSGGRREVIDAPRRQVAMFERRFGAPPAYIDGHHHCHAALPLATAVEDVALEMRMPVRAVGEDHRFRLDERGIACPDRLVGRLREDEPILPRVLAESRASGALPWGTTEWVVHPGRSDPEAGSNFDKGREEDLELLLQLADDETLARGRATHRVALGAAAG